MSNSLVRALKSPTGLMPSKAVRACWRRGFHNWEERMCDVPTCRDCARRQIIPRDVFDFGD